MTLMGVMVFMAVFAFVLMAAAPSVYVDVQRERELESIRRGEEIAEAIRQYVVFYRGAKLPSSMDDLLEGLPNGTKKRQILRASATIDPLSPDGKWRMLQPEPDTIARFAKRIQAYNHGILPSSPDSRYFDKYTVSLANVLNTETDEQNAETDDEEDTDLSSADGPFIGVASKSRAKSVITYYGLENHSKWYFTPLFRGTGVAGVGPPVRPPL